MKVTHLLAGFAVIAAWGCESMLDEAATKPSLIRVANPALEPRGGNPSPAPSASPSPRPSPVASPSPGGPGVVVPSPRPSATPTPAPSPSPSPGPALPSPSPRPSPSPAPALAPGVIDHVRVGFFGINCGRGNPVPRNNERILPRGCRGYVTATPKKANGDDVPANVHGPDIEWFILTGDAMIDVQDPTFRSDFNKDIVGVREGAFGLCATVREVTGCLMGSVVP